MKKTNGELFIKIIIDCPHCEACIDLTEITELIDDGFIYWKCLDGDSFGCEDVDAEIDCPECKKEISIGEITW